MKFVCDRCLTKYAIADDKVRGKVLKVRCKNCSNVVTVREPVPVSVPASVPRLVVDGESGRTVVNDRPHAGGAAAAVAPRVSRPTPAPITPLGRHDSGRAGAAVAAARMPAPALVHAPARVHTPIPAAAPADEVQWFLALDGVQKGPFSRKVLVDRLVALPRTADVHVWNEDLDAWKPPRQIPGIAHEMAARQAHLAPPPPPPPRARTIPPVSAVSAPLQTSGQSAAARAPAGSLPLGGVTAAMGSGGRGAAAAAPDLAIDLATPPPQRVHNGSGAAAVTPAALLPGAESDALNALDLGLPSRKPAAPVGTAAQVAAVRAEVRAKGPRMALVAAFLGVVGVCIAVLYNFVLVKRPGPAVTPPAAEKAEGAKGAAPGEPAPAVAKLAGDATKGDKELGRPAAKQDPKDDGKDDKEPSSIVIAGPAGKATALAKKQQNRGRAPHSPQGTSLEPAPFNPSAASSLNTEQQAAAARFAENQRRVVPIHGGAGSGSRTGPDQGEITRVVNNNKGGIKICYQRALLRDPTLTHGKIEVEISIGLSGRVKKVSIDGPTSFRILEPCIRDVIGHWVFPTSSEEYVTQFASSFTGNE